MGKHGLESLTEWGNAARRAVRGLVAGMICVLPLYYGLWDALAEAGLRFEPYPRRGAPLIVWLILAGGLLGAGFGLVLPLWRWATWKAGALLGVLVTLAVWFGVAPLTGTGEAGEWRWVDMAHAFTVFAGWGTAVGLALAWIPWDGSR